MLLDSSVVARCNAELVPRGPRGASAHPPFRGLTEDRSRQEGWLSPCRAGQPRPQRHQFPELETEASLSCSCRDYLIAGLDDSGKSPFSLQSKTTAGPGTWWST